MVQLIDNGFIRLFALWMIITVKHCSSAIHAPGCWFSNAIRMFLGKYITDVHWFVVVQCYTWRFMSYTSSIICCCNGLSLPNLAWLSARSGCCFSSYLHLTLTVFHQLIIPLRYLTIKFGISLFSPYSASSAPSLQGPSLHSIPIWWCSSIIIILSSGNILAALVSSWSVFGCCGGCFYISNFLFASYAYDRANTPSSIWFIRPLTFILQLFHRACWRSTLFSLIFKSFHLLSVSKPRAANFIIWSKM